MCSDITHAADITGAGYAPDVSIGLRRAVVSFVHPQDIDGEHALSIDFRSDNGDPTARVAVELDPDAARHLAETILRTLSEVRRS